MAARREEVFPFFSEARNLELLTPDWLHFEVLTPGAVSMEEGARIDYRLRLRGFPLRWRSEITSWEPPVRFVDRQVKGPYRLWEHEHRFEPHGSGCRVLDRVRYAVPGGPGLERLVQRWLVGPDVERIFACRRRRIRERFGAAPEEDR